MSLSAIKREELVHDIPLSHEKALNMSPLTSPEQSEKSVEKLTEAERNNQKKLYVNSLRIATTLAAAMSSKASYINKRWDESEGRAEEDCCDNEDYNEDIDIDGDEYDTQHSDDERNLRLHKEKLSNDLPQNLVSSNSRNSSCNILDSSAVLDSRNIFLSNSHGGFTTVTSSNNLLSSFGNSFNSNGSDTSTSTHSSPTCPTHTIDSILGIRNLHQEHQNKLMAHQNFPPHSSGYDVTDFTSSETQRRAFNIARFGGSGMEPEESHVEDAMRTSPAAGEDDAASIAGISYAGTML